MAIMVAPSKGPMQNKALTRSPRTSFSVCSVMDPVPGPWAKMRVCPHRNRLRYPNPANEKEEWPEGKERQPSWSL